MRPRNRGSVGVSRRNSGAPIDSVHFHGHSGRYAGTTADVDDSRDRSQVGPFTRSCRGDGSQFGAWVRSAGARAYGEYSRGDRRGPCGRLSSRGVLAAVRGADEVRPVRGSGGCRGAGASGQCGRTGRRGGACGVAKKRTPEAVGAAGGSEAFKVCELPGQHLSSALSSRDIREVST